MRYWDKVKGSLLDEANKIVGAVLVLACLVLLVYMVYGFYDTTVGKTAQFNKQSLKFCKALCISNDMKYNSGVNRCSCYTVENKSLVGINRTVQTMYDFRLVVE